MAGIVPSREFNEQLKRTVRETARRQRANVGSSGRWHKKGGRAARRLVRICNELPGRESGASEELAGDDPSLPWIVSQTHANVIGVNSAGEFYVSDERITVHNIWLMYFEHRTVMIVESILGMWVPSVSDCTGEEFDSADECFDEEPLIQEQVLPAVERLDEVAVETGLNADQEESGGGGGGSM